MLLKMFMGHISWVEHMKAKPTGRDLSANNTTVSHVGQTWLRYAFQIFGILEVHLIRLFPLHTGQFERWNCPMISYVAVRYTKSSSP